MSHHCLLSTFFFFNDTATTEIYTLSLHDALPISLKTVTSAPEQQSPAWPVRCCRTMSRLPLGRGFRRSMDRRNRSEEHTSELQSLAYLVCRLLLEKKKAAP